MSPGTAALSFCFADADLARAAALYGLPAAMTLIGLAGSLGHCAGMCGPFVLGRIAIGAEGRAPPRGEFGRLKGGLLLPYHLGRMTTYSALGGLAGGLGDLVSDAPGFRIAAAGALLVAALVLLRQALGRRKGAFGAGGLARALARAGSWLVGDGPRLPEALGLYGFGLVLGLLPCGLLWGALAIAAGTGDAATGARAMAGFALGTMPVLIAIGWAGAFAGARMNGRLRSAARPLLLINAGWLVLLAGRLALS